MTNNECVDRKIYGFTLIEMSIVLVIIGLIVGAILVGQDIINAAQVRATVSQVEKYNSAVNTFRTKYNDMPGDMLATRATQFGLYSETTLAGTAGNQDANGLIEGGSSGATVAMGETIIFWAHLSTANLISGQLAVSGNSIIVPTSGKLTGNITKVFQSLPPDPITPPQYFTVFSANGLNYLEIVPLTGITAASGAYTFGTVGLTPIQAFSIDSKLDDGLPQTGAITTTAITGALNAPPSFNPVVTNNTCDLGNLAATDTYNRDVNFGGMDGSCGLRFRFE